MNPINCLSCYPLIDCPKVRHWLPVTLQLTFKRTMSREKTDADVTSTITGKWRLKVKRCIKTWIRKWVDKPFCCERLLFFLLPFVSRDKVPKKIKYGNLSDVQIGSYPIGWYIVWAVTVFAWINQKYCLSRGYFPWLSGQSFHCVSVQISVVKVVTQTHAHTHTHARARNQTHTCINT